MTLHKKLHALLLIAGLFFTSMTFAVEPLPEDLIQFNSEKGTLLFQRNVDLNAIELFAHFTTQQTKMTCGSATAVMLLNALIIDEAPVDPVYDPYAYFTEDNFFSDEVLEIITPEEVEQNGMTLGQLADALATYNVDVELSYASDLTLERFRTAIKSALSLNKYVSVNFDRKVLFDIGSGHHSPIAAYDVRTDRFLVLDVSRYRYASYWVTVDDLWDAANTTDNDAGESRGFLVVSELN